MGKNSRILLQPRDLLLFQRLCQFGYFDIQQIADFIFQTSYRNTSRRLLKLKAAGLLTYTHRRDYLGSRVYIPNLKEFGSLVSEELYDQGVKTCSYKPWYNLNTEHEDLVRLWGLKVLSLYPQATLKIDYALDSLSWGIRENAPGSRKKLPDFVLEEDGKVQMTFEIELHPKTSQYYLSKFSGMAWIQSRPIVYLTRSQSIKNKIERNWKDALEILKGRNQLARSALVVRTFDEVQDIENLRQAIEKAKISPLAEKEAEKHAETAARRIAEEQQNAKLKELKEIEDLRRARLAQLNKDAPQTPPSLHAERKGFARVQQNGPDEQSNLMKTIKKLVWD